MRARAEPGATVSRLTSLLAVFDPWEGLVLNGHDKDVNLKSGQSKLPSFLSSCVCVCG